MTLDSFADAVGILGSVLIILAYFLLQAGKVRPDSWLYLYANGFAAAFMLFSLCFAPNNASIIINLFWLGISVYGIIRKRKGSLS